MAESAARKAPWLVALGLLSGALLIYLGVSLTSSESLQEPAGEVESDSDLVFALWIDSTWQEAALRPALVLLLVGDSLSPRSLEVESLLRGLASRRQLLASNFVVMRVDRRVRPDLALRYAEGLSPHLSVLLPTGEALARIQGEPETWPEQLAETERYWRDHQEEIADRARAFWAELEADSLHLPWGRPQASDIEVIDSAVFELLHNLLQSDSPEPALWRSDLDRYLAARRGDRADSVWRALKAARARRAADQEIGPFQGATPAEWARTVIELRLLGAIDPGDSALWAVQEWFARRGGPVTAEEAALTQRLALLLQRELRPSYPGTWLGLDSGSTQSLPHLRSGPSALDGYLMDALAWLELYLEAPEPSLVTHAQRLADSLWLHLWDPASQALRDKPVAPGRLRETRVHPRAQLGRAASLFFRLSGLTGESRFAARADSCLAGFAPFVKEAGPAATYYGEALLLRSQPAGR